MKYKSILGKDFELTAERKEHILTFHPDLKPYFSRLKDVFSNPEEIRISKSDPQVLLLNLYYDKEADVLYFSKGQPSADDISDETEDEMVIRKNPYTQEVTGFTILNFSKRSKKAPNSFKLPVEVNFKQATFI